MVASKKHRAEKLPPSLPMGMMGIGVEPGWMELGAGWCLFTLLSMLVGFFFYFYAPSWKVRKVPGPPALPIVGHLLLLGKHGPDFPGVLAKTYGPIFRFHIGRQPIVVVSDAELCKEIGVKQFKIFRNRSLPSAITGFPLHSKGLFNSKDPRWSAMRNTIVSLYQPTHLASLIPIMQSYIAAAAERLARPANPQEDDILFSNFTLQLATDVLGEAAFGVDFGLSKGIPPPASSKEDDGDDEISEFIKAHIYATKAIKMDLSSSLSIIIGLIVPFLQEPFRRVLTWIPGMADWKIERLNRSLSMRLDNIIAKRAMQKERGEKNFVSVILNARDSGQASSELFTPDYISALAYEHLLAGSTSTSFTMSSIVYLVSIHPEVEEKLLQEIDAFGPPDLVPTAEDLHHKFPYVDQVIKESMRFFTASPFMGREAMQQVKIGDYVLPKGTWVWMAPGIMVKDPKHFPEPHLFKPERFDPSGEEEKKRHPYAYFPFGIGPRSCIAQKYALQEIKLTVIHLYRNYVFRHSPLMENPLQLQYGIILYFKHGVRIHAIKRSKLN